MVPVGGHLSAAWLVSEALATAEENNVSLLPQSFMSGDGGHTNRSPCFPNHIEIVSKSDQDGEERIEVDLSSTDNLMDVMSWSGANLRQNGENLEVHIVFAQSDVEGLGQYEKTIRPLAAELDTAHKWSYMHTMRW
jgi:hypothetical protein